MSDIKRRRVGLRSDTNSRQSMDRFGDDLCQLLLSYLSLEEVFRYEEVSKQWQRVIYETQYEIPFEIMSEISDKTFELIVKKCKNITTIEDYSSKISMDAIIKDCHKLHSICYTCKSDENVETIEKFITKFAKQLKFSDIRGVTENKAFIKQRLKRFTNLTQIDTTFSPLPVLLSGNQNEILFKKLQKVCVQKIHEEIDSFTAFARIYGKQLKAIQVFGYKIVSFVEWDNQILINCLSEMTQLIDLKIQVLSVAICSDQLKQLAINCPKLKRLSLYLDDESNDNFLKMIQTINDYFNRLKRLEIRGQFPEEFVLMSESLAKCKQLTYLTICSYGDNKITFVPNFANHFPKLQYLYCYGCKKMTSNILNSLSLLPKIQTIRLYDETYSIERKDNNEITLKPLNDWKSAKIIGVYNYGKKIN